MQTQLQAVERELALSEATGRDLCRQLLWEKDSLSQVLELVPFQNVHVSRFHCTPSTLIAATHAICLLDNRQSARTLNGSKHMRSFSGSTWSCSRSTATLSSRLLRQRAPSRPSRNCKLSSWICRRSCPLSSLTATGTGKTTERS